VGASLNWLARRTGRAFLIIFGLSCAVQGFFLTKLDVRYLRPNTRWEVQAVAVSLAETGSFADPYILPTGPTAHVAPIPPAVSALVFKVFGLTLVGGYADWLLRMAFTAAVWGLLPWLAGRVGLGSRAGVIAGVVGALIPSWPSHRTALTALALGLLMIAFLRRWQAERTTAPDALLLGLACGAAFHVQPVLLSVVAGWIFFELVWSGTRRRWASTALIALGIVLACLPWAWRNHQTFDAVFFIRSNFGLELRMGHHRGATPAMHQMDGPGELQHPRLEESEARKVREWGEIVYMRRAGREALQWIRANPLSSAKLVGTRVALWWLGPLYDPTVAVLVTFLTGLAVGGVWRSWATLSIPQRAAVLIPLLTYPLIYYVVAYMPSYRKPINWLFILLAAAAVNSWLDRGRH
jgi:4-amino-4-deoxy-L-arabinose transferase-like glycosyltransferase